MNSVESAGGEMRRGLGIYWSTGSVVAAAVFLLAFFGIACSDEGGSGGSNSEVGSSDTTQGDLEVSIDADSAGEDAAGEVAGETVSPKAFDPLTRGALQALLDEHVLFSADRGLTLSVLADDGRAWDGAAGLASLQDGTAMTPGTGFRVGSNTKPIIATIALQLVDEGALGLDDPLTDYLPEYPQWEAVTVRHLLNMRSGIMEYLRDTSFMMETVQSPEVARAPAEIIAYVADEPLDFPVDSDGQYTNTSYMLLGMIIEKITGEPIEDEIQRRVVEPLGLENTYLDMTGEERDDVARGYMDLNLVGQVFGVPPAVLAFIPDENIYEGSIVDCSYLFHPSITWAAGALVASSPDMTRFMKELLSGGFLSAATMAEMKTTQKISLLGSRVDYGLGLQVRSSSYGDVIGHGGLNFGYQAGTYYHADSGMTFSHMHNYLPEQSDSFQNDLLGILIDGVEELREPCLPPEGFFDADDGPRVAARFKGSINKLATPQGAEIPGVNFWNLHDGEDTTALYGWGAHARFTMTAGQDLRLYVTSASPSTDSDVEMRSTVIALDPALFDDVAENGTYNFGFNNIGAGIVTISDLDVDENLEPLKLCFTGVTDFMRPGRLHVCEPGSVTPVAGEELRIFASMPVELDLAKVEQTLAQIQLPRCLCPDDSNGWEACQ